MLGPIEGSLEFSSLGIFECDSEGVKEVPLLGFKDTIKKVDKLWSTLAFPKSVYYDNRIYILNWNSEGILLGILSSTKLGLYENTMISVSE